MAKKFTDEVISHYGNGTGYMAIRTYEDGSKATVHTGKRTPKAKTSYAGKGRTNIGDPTTAYGKARM